MGGVPLEFLEHARCVSDLSPYCNDLSWTRRGHHEALAREKGIHNKGRLSVASSRQLTKSQCYASSSSR